MDNRTNLIIEDIVAFLKKVPPFFSLDDSSLQSVAKHLSVEFYPRGTVILKQNDSSRDSLRIIKKGRVRISTVSPDNGEEAITDYRGEGDTFGFLSLVSRDPMRSNITAVEDTICYALGKKILLSLLDSHLSFTDYFLKSHITKYVDRIVLEMQDKNMFRSGGDRLLITTRVGDIAIKDVVSTRDDTTILAAAQVMASKRINSIIIMDHDNRPWGIVTDRDLREKVVAQGRNVLEPIKNIMSTPLISVDAQDHCFEIVLKMIKYNIHHIIATRDNRLYGVITNHDLMMLQGTSPLSLTKDIENQQTIDGLIPVSKKINSTVFSKNASYGTTWNDSLAAVTKRNKRRLNMQVKTIHDVRPEIHEDGCSGLIHLDPIYRDLEKHPEIAKHRPCSPWGDCFLAQFDNSEYFVWVKPVAGGASQTIDPVFLIIPCEAITSSSVRNKSLTGERSAPAF